MSRHGGLNKHIQLYSYYGCELYCSLVQEETKILDMEFRTNTHNCTHIMVVNCIVIKLKKTLSV